MKQGDHEHVEFEKFAESKKLDRNMHPLHLLYLDNKASDALSAFQAGYEAGKRRDNLLEEKAYLKNRADLVDGHYCIARRHKEGYHEFWNDKAKSWCSAASVFEIGKQ
tara:strand:- start:5928 stop:6251 length:324 start_codon:yes stop_codon:yes gene_type:complete